MHTDHAYVWISIYLARAVFDLWLRFIHVYVCTYMHKFLFQIKHTCIYVLACICMCILTYIHKACRKYMYWQVYACAYIHAYVSETPTAISNQNKDSDLDTYGQYSEHETQLGQMNVLVRSLYTHTYIYIYIHTYIHTYMQNLLTSTATRHLDVAAGTRWGQFIT
jgi:hypothetical protein